MKRKPLIITGVSILTVLGMGYIGGGLYYGDHFLPNTSIETTDISGITVEEANRRIAKELHANTISITENNETIKTVTPLDLHAKIESDAYFKALQAEQNNWLWPLAFFNEDSVDASKVNLQFDEAAVTTLLEELTASNDERVAPVSANVKSKEGTFVIEPEVLGTLIDPESLKQQLVETLVSGTKQLALEDAYVKPALTADSEELAQVVETLQDLADTAITYTLAGEEIVVPKEAIAQWLSLDESGQPTVSVEAAKAYLQTLQDKYATYEKTRSFQSTNRGTVEVPPGEYGWSIATQAESEKLAQYILAGEDLKATPAILGSGYHEDGTDIGNTYIEVDLVAQVMYYYQNGERVFETPIVSGHAQTPSPVGVFYAWNKVEDTDLIGYNPRRGNDYAQPVDYWIPINWDGIGIHDANWQASFASDVWATNGSNGCINTPPGAMATLFSLIEVGTPVIFL